MIAFIDIETTGLDTDSVDILEIGVTLTTYHFEKIAEEVWVRYMPEYQLPKMDKWCQSQHVRSGLWEECRQSKVQSYELIDAAIVSFIERNGGAKGLMLGGRSVHFDRAIIRRCLPQLDNFLHYRHLDISSVEWFLSLADRSLSQRSTRSTHRALDDNDEAIQTAIRLKGYLNMEKNAVVTKEPEAKTKTAGDAKVTVCPVCSKIADTSGNTPKCPLHGSAPWEK